MQYRKSQLTKHKFISTQAIADYLMSKLSGLKHEEFHVLYLDSKNQLLADKNHFTGTINASAVYPREVIKTGLDLGATRLILAHNHPSGDPTPSPEDIRLTMEIGALAVGLGMDVYDHLIIGTGKYVSLRESGQM